MKLIKRLFSSGIIVLIIHTNVAGQPAVLKEAPIKVEEAGRIQPSAQPYYSPSFALLRVGPAPLLGGGVVRGHRTRGDRSAGAKFCGGLSSRGPVDHGGPLRGSAPRGQGLRGGDLVHANRSGRSDRLCMPATPWNHAQGSHSHRTLPRTAHRLSLNPTLAIQSAPERELPWGYSLVVPHDISEAPRSDPAPIPLPATLAVSAAYRAIERVLPAGTHPALGPC